MSDSPFDAIMVVSFGGPEGPDDVMPFLENVLRGKNVPQSRMLEVAEHYNHFGGVSPINQQNRDLIAALEQELADRSIVNDAASPWGSWSCVGRSPPQTGRAKSRTATTK